MDIDHVVHNSNKFPFMVQTLDIGLHPFIAALTNELWQSTTREEVLVILLEELRAMAEVQLGLVVRTVVLTMHVSFSWFQQTQVEKACAMVGFHVLCLIPEPTTVALLYDQQQQMTSQANMGSGTEQIALIFNMGAGYCDVVVAATTWGGGSQIKSIAWDAIGGEDILQNVFQHVSPNVYLLSVVKSRDASKSVAMLRIVVQKVIHSLSMNTGDSIEVDLGDGQKI